jgi:RNA polymerase sigma-70 factor, ECF subfamily
MTLGTSIRFESRGRKAFAERDLQWLVEEVGHRRDHAAFQELATRMASRLLGFFVSRGLDRRQAEDVRQDVMLSVWCKAAQFDPERADVVTWLFAIARHRWIDQFRKERKHGPPLLEEDPCTTEELEPVLVQRERAREVQEAIAQLPAGQADVLRRAYFEGQSLPDIAGTLGLPVGTAKSRMRAALANLRRVEALRPA